MVPEDKTQRWLLVIAWLLFAIWVTLLVMLAVVS